MNFQYRRLSIKLKPTSWLLSFISITILTSVVKGLHSHTAEWANKNNQHVYSDLMKAIREFSSIKDGDDTDKRFQSLVDNDDQDQLLLKGYRLINSQYLISPFQITTPDERFVDGSGITIEETKSSSTSSTITLTHSSTSSSSTTEQITNEISSSTAITTSTTTTRTTTITTTTITTTSTTTTSKSPQPSLSSTNWKIIVAVISAILVFI
ncbi:unnamed protein product [Rotaria sordida]|uniref:Uncharacterized protein n=2 Tax=Rotaria sordida TaxID=392033 RepID=A0A815Q7C2_9BILA|nr:unnamed protein product [Rotaria sordida]